MVLGYIIRVYALRALVWLLGVALVIVLAGAGGLYFFFGGGEPYSDTTSAPLLPGSALEAVVQSARPPGAVAVAQDGRVFYTVHPEAGADAPYLMVARDGQTAPFPDADRQGDLFQTPAGLDIDAQGRLWVVDSGRHGLGTPQLVALDTDSGQVVYQADLGEVAPAGSYLRNVQVGPEGAWVYVTDAGFWAQRPGLIVYEVATGHARKVLSRHETVMPQGWLIRTPMRDMRFLGGLVTLKVGADGLALTGDGAWLYFSAMSHSTLYRVPTALLKQPDLPHVRLAVDIETVSRKPLSSGLEVDADLNVFIADIEHGALHRFNDTPPEEEPGTLVTLLRDDRLRWPAALAFGPDGWLYMADSALPLVLNRDRAAVAAAGPYTIWRVRPDAAPAAGGAPQTTGE